MPVIRRITRGWKAMLLVCVCAGAWAQDASLTLYVFKQGLPQQFIEVLVDDRVVTFTNNQGVAVLEVPPGLRRLELRDQDLVVLDQQILVHEEELSQWIVNITRGLSSLVDVESSNAGVLPGVIGAPTDSAAQAVPGTLSGRLFSADDGTPVDGARVFISGQSTDIRSDAEGRFEVQLPTGTYSVSVLHTSFNSLTRDDIVVSEGDTTALDLEMTPSGSELPEFVVIEPYIAGSLASVLEERRTGIAVANILGAEQISRAGDSDAAGALRRVTGLTLVDGRFIYVRGLGERYSSTLLNGANVPTPDPTRRVVPLDLFPTAIIDSIAVRKGYTAELPGEFGGGTVELRTRSIPESAFISMELSTAFRSGTSFSDGLRYEGGGRDWTGRDDGTRQQPEVMQDAIGDGERLVPFNRFTGTGFDPETMEEIGESLPVNYDAFGEELDPNLGFRAAGGYAHTTGDGLRIGFQVANEYDNEWLNTSERRTDFVNGGGGLLVPQNDFSVRSTVHSIDLSWFLTAGLEFDDRHRLDFNWMQLGNTTDLTQIEQGRNKDVEGGDVRFVELKWTEREMNAAQLLGQHRFPSAGDLQVNWHYTLAQAGSEEPDTRRYRYDPDRRTTQTDDFVFSLRNDGNRRSWSVLEDQSDSWKVDFRQPISLSDALDAGVSMGFEQVDKTRDSGIRRFSYNSRGPLSNDVDLLRNPSVEDIILADTIDPHGWQLEEVTSATDAYTASQDVSAWHLGIELNIGEQLRLASGFRDERSDLASTTFNLFDPQRLPVVTTQNTDDTFPFATATWLLGDHQLRGGYARTINRPDFKELSPSQYKDPVLDRTVVGNPDLQPAYIEHYDLRWDYYFNPGEFISLGVFYKEFETPIEIVILASAGNALITLDNAETADNVGLEFELYRYLGFLNDRWDWGAFWEQVYVNTNYAWIESDITLADDASTIQTNDNRPLQGQSPWVLNFQLGFEDEQRGIDAALLYNVFGERIVEVGVQGAPDKYEQPRPSLDFVYSHSLGPWGLKFRARNLLDPEIEITQGSETTRLIQPIGREYTIGLEYTF